MKYVRLDGKSRYADGRELVTVQVGPDEFLCQVPADYVNPAAVVVEKAVFEAVKPAAPEKSVEFDLVKEIGEIKAALAALSLKVGV